jgi:hypothetical protein
MRCLRANEDNRTEVKSIAMPLINAIRAKKNGYTYRYGFVSGPIDATIEGAAYPILCTI